MWSCTISFAVFDFRGIAISSIAALTLFIILIRKSQHSLQTYYCLFVSNFIKIELLKYKKHLNYNFCVFKAFQCTTSINNHYFVTMLMHHAFVIMTLSHHLRHNRAV